MKNNARIVGMVLIGLGAWLLGSYVQGASQRNKKHVKKIAKEAVNSWEGEGGAIVERAPRTTTA